MTKKELIKSAYDLQRYNSALGYNELMGIVVISQSNWMLIKIGEGRFYGEIIATKKEGSVYQNLVKQYIGGIEIGKLAGYAVIVKNGRIARKEWLPTILRKRF